LTHRWFDVAADQLLPGPPVAQPLPSDVASGDGLTVDAAFTTPDLPGTYLLLWSLQVGDDLFSRLRIEPVFTEVDVVPGAQRRAEDRDLSHWTRPEPGTALDASVSRPRLWRAALEMFLERPVIGSGPDSFRVRYGSYLGYSEWDTGIRANSLYLELLATVGVLGLAAFGVVVAVIGWRPTPAHLSLLVFLLHGLGDVFLMTTPIYFAFWLLAATAAPPNARASQGSIGKS
jgi:hypothetical protein